MKVRASRCDAYYCIVSLHKKHHSRALFLSQNKLLMVTYSLNPMIDYHPILCEKQYSLLLPVIELHAKLVPLVLTCRCLFDLFLTTHWCKELWFSLKFAKNASWYYFPMDTTHYCEI